MTANPTRTLRGGRSLVAAAIACGALAVLVRPALSSQPVAQAATRAPARAAAVQPRWVGGEAEVRVGRSVTSACPCCSAPAGGGAGAGK